MTRDLRETWTTSHDRPISESLRSGMAVGQHGRVSFSSLTEGIEQVKRDLGSLKDANPRLHARYDGYINRAQSALNALDIWESHPSATSKVLVSTAINTALMTLPWLLATDPAKVKNLDPGESRLSKEFMLVMAAYQAKTLALTASHIRSPVSNAATLTDFVKERHAYDTQGFLTGAPSTFVKTIHDKVDGSPLHTLGRAGASAIALNALFQTDTIGSLANRAGTGLHSLATTGSFKNATAYPRLQAQSKMLNTAQRDMLATTADSIDTIRKTLEELETHLRDTGRAPSMAWSQHLENAKQSLDKAATELRVAAKDPEEAADAVVSQKRQNTDRNEKLLLVGVGALVYALNLAAVINDGLAVADVVGDALFSMPILLAKAYDPNVTAESAKDAFKSFVGVSLVSGIILGVNAAAQDPIGKNDTLLYAMFPIFVVLANTLPSPAADGLTRLLDKMCACVRGETPPRESNSTAETTPIDIGRHPAAPSPVVVEMPDDGMMRTNPLAGSHQ